MYIYIYRYRYRYIYEDYSKQTGNKKRKLGDCEKVKKSRYLCVFNI